MVISEAFTGGQTIPSKHTGDGEDVSPDISWQGAPEETKTFVLIAEDPETSTGTTRQYRQRRLYTSQPAYS
ncbi:MAG: hypothetical protein JSV32_08220 [Dehalococcoidia bacterium]|nr:MAG: hypothetical protein JSV32_08220 [Dehalococcoidia bacterium]